MERTQGTQRMTDAKPALPEKLVTKKLVTEISDQVTEISDQTGLTRRICAASSTYDAV
jgi:hypothetical protein